jgi:hypothetical protein
LLKALEWESEPLMIDSHAVQYRGVDVVDVDGVLGDVVAEIVCFPIFDSTLDPSTGHPHAETLRMVISPVVGFRESPLAINGPSEFAAPDDQG